ncbi:MAG: hypothetical protein M1818_004541 [Claussenomyces sp. TS43310]|nr:MAG: hypothetical protein M1818_004541 [Claussenomyces sp. TS43310]
MDNLMERILSFPPHPSPSQPLSDQQYDEGIRTQIEMLSKVDERRLKQPTSSGEHILEIISPSLNTVPYAYALVANNGALLDQPDSTISGEIVWQKMTSFLNYFDPRQARYIGSLLTAIIETIADHSRRLRQVQPEMAIIPIANAILRLDPTGSTLTSNHLLLAQLSLESKSPFLAAPVLERQVLYFPSATSSRKPKTLSSPKLPPHSFLIPETGFTRRLKYQEVLEYFVLCGTVHIACQRWEKALDALESAITYPVKENAVSKIMVEAYKKWILVHIVLHGKAGKLPSTTNSNAAKVFHTLATPYETVASLFESASAPRLNEEVSFGSEIWKEDTNTGLMNLVLGAYQRYQIRHLAQVYRSISISEVTRLTVSAETGANLTSDQDTERLVSDMISQGTLHAHISRSADSIAVLEFDPDDRISSEVEIKEELAASLLRLKSIMEAVTSTDHRLTHEKEYLKYMARLKAQGKDGSVEGSMGEDAWSVGNGHGIEDEDLMEPESY